MLWRSPVPALSACAPGPRRIFASMARFSLCERETAVHPGVKVISQPEVPFSRCETRARTICRAPFARVASAGGDKAELPLQRPAQHMAQQNVHFLDAGGGIRRHHEEMVGKTPEVAAALAGEGRGHEPLRPRLPQRGEDIGAPARGGNGDGDVALPPERLDLAGEDALEAEVIAGRRQG